MIKRTPPLRGDCLLHLLYCDVYPNQHEIYVHYVHFDIGDRLKVEAESTNPEVQVKISGTRHNISGDIELFEAVYQKPRAVACYHEWKEYIGFTDKYYYCTKCNEKQK